MKQSYRENRIGQKGASKITLIVFGAILCVVGWVGYEVFPIYYKYLELESELESLCRVADQLNHKELRTKLREVIRRNDLPFTIDEIDINKDDDGVSLAVSYSEVFSVWWQEHEYVIREFHFDAYAEHSFSER